MFMCMTVNSGLCVWLYEIDWALWDCMVRVVNWVMGEYVNGPGIIPWEKEVSPFTECPFYDEYLECLRVFQMNYVSCKHYTSLDPEWVDEGFDRLFFDDENGNDGRLHMTEEDQVRFANCSAECVPETKEEIKARLFKNKRKAENKEKKDQKETEQAKKKQKKEEREKALQKGQQKLK